MDAIKYNNEIIEYEINKAKRKNMYIVVKEEKVIARVPLNMPNYKIGQIMEKRKEWIYKQLQEQKSIKNKSENKDIVKINGKDYKLQVIYTNILKKPEMILEEEILYLYLPDKIKDEDKVIKKQIEKYYFKIAEIQIKQIMEEVINQVGIKPNSYKIKRLKRTWGNCSSTRNISLSVNLIKYSKHAIKYVILHEICHLKYMNHSKEFWDMVKSYMNDYKIAQQELKNNY